MSKVSREMIIDAVKNDYRFLYSPMPEEWKKVVPVVTVDFLTACGLHFTTKHTGKMSGMISLSTTCKCNNICKNRIKKALEKVSNSNDRKAAKKAIAAAIKADPYRTDFSICGFCFSDSQQDKFSWMVDPLAHNFEILNNGIIHSDWLPILNSLYFRFESFGDYASKNSAINTFNIAAKNPLVNCAAWTKNPRFFEKAILSGYGKPDNLSLILSSQFINKPTKNNSMFIDRVFTVYTPEYAERHNININCGARSCMNCLKCYKSNVVTVSELLK